MEIYIIILIIITIIPIILWFNIYRFIRDIEYYLRKMYERENNIKN